MTGYRKEVGLLLQHGGKKECIWNSGDTLEHLLVSADLEITMDEQ